MDIRQITHFIALAETGNFARAAEQIGITQSALTQSIARLEKVLEAKLFDRGRFGAVITEEGELLLPRAKLISTEHHLALSEFTFLKNSLRGDISIGIGKSVTQECVPDVLREFQKLKPEVVLTAIEGLSSELFLMLLNGQLDMVVSAPSAKNPVDPELIQEHLFFQQLELVISNGNPIAKKQNITLEDLQKLRWVVPPGDSSSLRQIQSIFIHAGLEPPQDFFRTNSTPLLLNFVEINNCVAIIFKGLSSQVYSSETFRRIEIPDFCEERSITLTRRRRSRLRPHAEALANEFRKWKQAQ